MGIILRLPSSRTSSSASSRAPAPSPVVPERFAFRRRCSGSDNGCGHRVGCEVGVEAGLEEGVAPVQINPIGSARFRAYQNESPAREPRCDLCARKICRGSGGTLSVVGRSERGRGYTCSRTNNRRILQLRTIYSHLIFLLVFPHLNNSLSNCPPEGCREGDWDSISDLPKLLYHDGTSACVTDQQGGCGFTSVMADVA